MCVIVHQPSGAYLSKKTAKEMWDRNPDGAGFAYIDDEGEIQTGHAMSFEKFWSMFETQRSPNRDKDFLVHFRIGTSGLKDITNVHPFQVDEHTVMAHNGMLNRLVDMPKDAVMSDTRYFIRDILSMLPENWLDNPVLFDMVEDYIAGSKLMFLTTNPALKKNVYILNEKDGTNKHNMWWSNDYHEKSSFVRYSTSSKTTIVNATPLRPDQTRGLVRGQGQLPVPQKSEWDNDDDAYSRYWTDDDVLKTLKREGVPVSEMPATLYLMEIIDNRKELDLTADIVLDPTVDQYECQTCFTYLKADGDCMCWELFCLNCGAVAPYCEDDAECDLRTLTDIDSWETDFNMRQARKVVPF